MRKIEIEMNNAVRNKIAWSKANTATMVLPEPTSPWSSLSIGCGEEMS